MKIIKNLGEKYTPYYFLAALGSGGLSISFFIYFMFMLPHPNTPMPTFEVIFKDILANNWHLASTLTLFGVIAIIFFALLHFYLLIWNIKEYLKFKKTSAFSKLKKSNTEVTLMAIPLTFAMSINVGFVLGAAFVPNLWNHVEYLFPLATLAFLLVGFYALKIFSDYFVRLITQANFDFASNNNLSQMISIFAFAMLAVGFAAPGAMSKTVEVSATALFFSIFFATIAVSLALVKITLGLASIFSEGISKEASVSLWIVIPILTILGITIFRITFGFHHSFIHADPSSAWLFLIGSAIFSLQIIFGSVGYTVMKKMHYFRDFIYGKEKSASSFSIICPGVSFFVFGMFFLNLSIVGTGMLEKFSLIYFILLVPFVLIQLNTLYVFFKLNKKIFIRN